MHFVLLFAMYTFILTINGFIIFHFIFLRFFSPKNYTGSTNKIINGYLEFCGLNTFTDRSKKYNFIYSRLGFCSNIGYLGKFVVEHNIKLNIEYGNEVKLNRWKRLPKFIIILITLLILLMSIINVFFLQFKLDTTISSHRYIMWFIILNGWFWIFIFLFNLWITFVSILNYFIYRPRLSRRSKTKVPPKTFKELLNYFYFESNKVFAIEFKLCYFIWLSTFWLLIILAIWCFNSPHW